MRIGRIELRLLRLPMRESFVAAHGRSDDRQITVVRIHTDHGIGWGECAALNEPTYNDEYAAGAFDVLDEELAPRLIGHDLDAANVHERLSMVAGNPMAKAALEMALLDAELRAAGTSLARWLTGRAEPGSDEATGHHPATVTAGAAVGLASPSTVADRVEALAADGFGRVKLKIQPGQDRQILDAVLARGTGIEIQLDGNGSYQATDLDLLADLAGSGITALEQPLPPRDMAAAVALAARCPVPLVADEAARSLAAVAEMHRRHALGGVSVKPSRLGGLGPARALHDQCRDWPVALTAGGMVETGLGRHALAALAALPGFTLTGDVSPAGRWLAADPWPDLVMTGGRVTVPTGPGVAPDPDRDLLDRLTTRRATVTA